MPGCFGHHPTFVRKLLLPEEGSILMGCEMLSWLSLQANIICVDGVVGTELCCHKKNNTEDPSHIKGVISGCQSSEIVTKMTEVRGWWGQYIQTWDRFLSIPSNIYKDNYSQWPSKVIQTQHSFVICNYVRKHPSGCTQPVPCFTTVTK